MQNLIPTPLITEVDLHGHPLRTYQLRALFALEGAMQRGNADGTLVPFECPVAHFFADGLYVRQMTIPAGVALVGHIHRYPCVNIVLGDIEVATAEGRKRIVGPTTFVSAAGIKRAGYALQDTLWTTIHANPDNERDIDKLEAALIVDVYDKVTGLPVLLEQA